MDNSVSQCGLKCQNFTNSHSLHFQNEVTTQQSLLMPTAQVNWMTGTAPYEKQTTQQW